MKKPIIWETHLTPPKPTRYVFLQYVFQSLPEYYVLRDNFHVHPFKLLNQHEADKDLCYSPPPKLTENCYQTAERTRTSTPAEIELLHFLQKSYLLYIGGKTTVSARNISDLRNNTYCVSISDRSGRYRLINALCTII